MVSLQQLVWCPCNNIRHCLCHPWTMTLVLFSLLLFFLETVLCTVHWLKVVRYMDGLIKSEFRGQCSLSDACWQPATLFGLKSIHQFKMAESGCNTVSYISANDVLCKTRKFLFNMWFVLTGVHVTTVRSAMDARTPGLLLVQGTCLSFYINTSKIYLI